MSRPSPGLRAPVIAALLGLLLTACTGGPAPDQSDRGSDPGAGSSAPAQSDPPQSDPPQSEPPPSEPPPPAKTPIKINLWDDVDFCELLSDAQREQLGLDFRFPDEQGGDGLTCQFVDRATGTNLMIGVGYLSALKEPGTKAKTVDVRGLKAVEARFNVKELWGKSLCCGRQVDFGRQQAIYVQADKPPAGATQEQVLSAVARLMDALVGKIAG